MTSPLPLSRQEAALIVPTTAREPGNAAEANRFAASALTTQFGGCTITEASGAWRNDAGEVIREPVNVYTVAMEATEANAIRLDAIADIVGRIAAQECVYVRYASGDVALRDTAKLWRKPVSAPLAALRRHVSDAIASGDAQAIVGLPEGVTAIGLDNPAALHDTIRKAVGE